MRITACTPCEAQTNSGFEGNLPLTAVAVSVKKRPKSRLPQALVHLADPKLQNEWEDFAVRAHYLERKAVVAA